MANRKCNDKKKNKKSDSYKDDLSSTISSIMSAIDRIYDDKKGKKCRKPSRDWSDKSSKSSKSSKSDKCEKKKKRSKKPKCEKKKSSKCHKKERKCCKIHYVTASPCATNAPVLRSHRINIPALYIDIDTLCAAGSNFLCEIANSQLSVANQMYVSLPCKPRETIKVLNLYLTDLNIVTNRQVKRQCDYPGSCAAPAGSCGCTDENASYVCVDSNRSFMLPVNTAAVFTPDHDKKCKNTICRGIWTMCTAEIGDTSFSFCC